jgi:hypothetical protein
MSGGGRRAIPYWGRYLFRGGGCCVGGCKKDEGARSLWRVFLFFVGLFGGACFIKLGMLFQLDGGVYIVLSRCLWGSGLGVLSRV